MNADTRSEPGTPTCAARLHVEVHGEGRPLVLSHGLGGSARNFTQQSRFLGARCRVWLYDTRGHARSEAPPGESAYRWDCLIADYDYVARRALADDRCVPHARIIAGGLSLGAATALHWTMRHPEAVSGLVLAAYPESGPREREWALRFADSIESEGLETAGHRFIWGPLGRFGTADSAAIRRGIMQHPPGALAAVLRRAMAMIPDISDILSELARLEMPTLVVVGARDTHSMAASRRIAESIPNARRVVIEDADHVVNLSQPQPFNSHLADFIDNL